MFIVLINGVHGSSAEAVGMSNAEQPIYNVAVSNGFILDCFL